MINQSRLTLGGELARGILRAPANKLIMFLLQMILDLRQGLEASLTVFKSPVGALANVGVLVELVNVVLQRVFIVEGFLARLWISRSALEVARSVGMRVANVRVHTGERCEGSSALSDVAVESTAWGLLRVLRSYFQSVVKNTY